MKTTPATHHHVRHDRLLSWKFAGLLLTALGLLVLPHSQAQSHVLTNLWNLAPNASHTFMDLTNSTRGIAYNPVTGHVLVPSRTAPAAIHILNGDTGAILGQLPFDSGVINGGTFVINLVGVTTDGVIYVGNLTTDATNTASGPFKLYRWANEAAAATLAYSGDPSDTNTVGTNPRRFGDSMAVRGTGAGTQILLGTYNSVVGLLTTTDGVNFTSTKIVTDAAAGDTRFGLAWGAGDTFWAKQSGANLKNFTLNLGAKTAATTINLASMVGVPAGALDVDLSRNLMAFVCTNHTVRIYDMSDLNAPQQQDVKNFPAANINGNLTGAATLREGRFYALESNNGIVGYTVVQTNLPPTITTAPAAVTIWENADNWTLTAAAGGTRPFTCQWRFNGTNIPGGQMLNSITPGITLSNWSLAMQGLYSVVVANNYGSVTSATALATVTPGFASGTISNLWDAAGASRIYLPTNYWTYGVAMNPVTTNVIVVTRSNIVGTNIVAVLDGLTGAHKHYIDYSGLLLSGSFPMNKVDVADDGIVYICNLTTTTATTPFTVYALQDDNATPADKWIAYQGDPGNGATLATDGWGRTICARGSSPNTQILVGTLSSTAKTVAILQEGANGAFTSTAITVPDAPAGFARLGLDWGPGNNTFWAKTSAGNLILVEFDLGTSSGFVRKSYPQTGSHSVPSSFTGLKYDPASGLLAGLQNGTTPRPVGIPVFDVSDLDAGPLWVDQELYASHNADIEFQGNVDFAKGYLVAMGINNGLKTFKVNAGTASLPAIMTHPASATWYRGTTPTMTVLVDSATTPGYQWYFNGAIIADATDSVLTLPNVQTNQAGPYKVRVTNTGGSRDSAAAILTVIESYTTTQMSNLWSLTAGSRSYLTTNYKQYGLAFNPANSNLLVVNLDVAPSIVVLNALNGDEKHILDLGIVAGGTKVLHKIDVADDGVVYAGNLTTAAAGNPFKLYRWADDQPTTAGTVAFSGDPGVGLWLDKACGYTLDVRGAGVNTEVIVGLGTSSPASNIVSILRTVDGLNFTATPVKVAAAPAGFARLGLCFGAGNTFWAKTFNGQIYLVQYDLGAGTGTILKTYTGTQFPLSVTALAYQGGTEFLAGSAHDTQKNIQIFSVADLTAGPQLRDQELFPTYNASIEANGELDFGGNYLFALNENNGIMAFLINANYVPPVTSFKVLSATASAGSVTLVWEAVNGAKYQVVYRDTITGTWNNLGSEVTASGTTASYVDNSPGDGNRFYRVQAVQ